MAVMTIIPALRKMKLENRELDSNLAYIRDSGSKKREAGGTI